jgi:hypothetical protein
MAKAEIGWTGSTEEGVKREVYAQHVGDRWIFRHRLQRFDQWQLLEQPPLDDWLQLLDAVRRRIARDLLRPEEEARVLTAIRERFPQADDLR